MYDSINQETVPSYIVQYSVTVSAQGVLHITLWQTWSILIDQYIIVLPYDSGVYGKCPAILQLMHEDFSYTNIQKLATASWMKSITSRISCSSSFAWSSRLEWAAWRIPISI